MPELNTQVIMSVVNNQQSTHGIAAQASAARMINILRKNYPNIASLQFVKHSTINPEEIEKKLERESEAQASLIAYLTPQYSLAESDVVKTHPQISKTIEIIEYLRKSTGYNNADKDLVFKQIKTIAAIHPGIKWDEHSLHWSSNELYYNKKTVVIIASPAEVLNLVCAAILESAKYLSTPASTPENDLALRVDTLFNALLTLEKQQNAIQRVVCATGLQHSFLFLLNRVYIENGQPIELIEDVESFLLASASLYLKQELSTLAKEEQIQLINSWLKWQASQSTGVSPVVSHLQTRSNTWQIECFAFMAKRCEDFGLDPNKCKLKEINEAIDYVPIPVLENSLVNELLTANQMPLCINLDYLITHRNNALTQVQNDLLSGDQHLSHEALSIFYSAETLFQSLYKYKDLSIFIGQEEENFKTALNALSNMLCDYFKNFTLYQTPPKDFETIKCNFLYAENVFNQRVNDFIINFFATIDSNEKFNECLNKLIIIHNRHSLALTEETLNSWFGLPNNFNEQNVSLSPYQINRIIFHTFVVPIHKWSPRFCQILFRVTQWLIDPRPSEDSLLDNIKKTSLSLYATFSLLVLCIYQNNYIDRSIREKLVNEYSSFSKINIHNGIFNYLYKNYSHVERVQILNSLKDQTSSPWLFLSGFIKTIFDLNLLIETPDFSVNEKKEIFLFMGNNLTTVIKSVNILWNLFLPSQNTNPVKQELWNIMKHKLSHLKFKCIDDVCCLLECFKQEEDHKLILQAFPESFFEMHKGYNRRFREFSRLYRCSPIVRSNSFFSYVEPIIIKTMDIESVWELIELLHNFSEDHRTMILKDLSKNLLLYRRVYTTEKLLILLNISILTNEQRTIILQSPKLFENIHGNVNEVLNCELLTDTHRKFIIEQLADSHPLSLCSSTASR